MTWDHIEGQWTQIRGQVLVQWGKLTDDDVEVVGGSREQLIGKLQQRYGVLREEAERQISAWQTLATDTWVSEGGRPPVPPPVL